MRKTTATEFTENSERRRENRLFSKIYSVFSEFFVAPAAVFSRP